MNPRISPPSRAFSSHPFPSLVCPPTLEALFSSNFLLPSEFFDGDRTRGVTELPNNLTGHSVSYVTHILLRTRNKIVTVVTVEKIGAKSEVRKTIEIPGCPDESENQLHPRIFRVVSSRSVLLRDNSC